MKRFLRRALKKVTDNEISRKFLSFFRKIMEMIPVRLGENSHYTEEDYRAAFLYSALTKGTAERTDQVLRDKGYEAPSGDRQIDVIKELSLEEMELMFDEMLALTLREGKRLGAFRLPVDIAIDPTDIPYYGDTGSPFVIGTKHKQGTSWAHSFVCTDIVVEGHRFTVDFSRRTIQSRNKDLVEKGLRRAEKWVKTRFSLLDREFYTVDVVNLHKRMDLKFVIPSPDTAGIKKVKEEYKNSLPATVNYTMCSGQGLETDVSLCLAEKDDQVHGFISNSELEAEDVTVVYPRRWGVETGHKGRNKFRGRTCSRAYKVRYFYYGLSVVLYNFWILVNLVATIHIYGSPGEPVKTIYQTKAFLKEQILRTLETASRRPLLAEAMCKFPIFR